MDDRPRQGLSGWSKILGWVLSLVALGIVAKLLVQTDASVWRNLAHLHLGWAALSVLLFQAWFALRFWCWEKITRRLGIADARPQHLRMWTLSELMRYVPGNIWSFAARYRGARVRGGTTGTATVALVVEALNLVAGASIITAVFLYPAWWWLWAVALVVYGITIPVFVRLVARWRRWDQQPALTPKFIYTILAASMLLWAVYGGAQALVIIAVPNLGLPALWYLAGANVAAWLIGYLSIITPMGLGVREVTLVSLIAASVAEGVASILAVLTRVWLVLNELIFLAIVLLFSRRRVE